MILQVLLPLHLISIEISSKYIYLNFLSSFLKLNDPCCHNARSYFKIGIMGEAYFKTSGKVDRHRNPH